MHIIALVDASCLVVHSIYGTMWIRTTPGPQALRLRSIPEGVGMCASTACPTERQPHHAGATLAWGLGMEVISAPDWMSTC